MINILEKYEKNQIEQLMIEKSHPKFNPGDTLKVHLKVKEGEKERIQVFEGVCIAKKNAGINSSFTIRKISYGEGIERVLPLFSPQINKIELSKQGNVRRSKLYYLRSRSGKSARISEKNTFSNDAEKNNEKVKQNETESKLVESVEATSKKNFQEDSVKVKPSKSEEKQ
jgi:large subunit ribosomal protein L19|tara:strand:+ start:1504 stop:2013 length:510 start_codon:yes stop_codon:yes gene_type:complete